MTDVEMLMQCARGRGFTPHEHQGQCYLYAHTTLTFSEPKKEVMHYSMRYDPLNDDDTCMELIKQHHLKVTPPDPANHLPQWWIVSSQVSSAHDPELNRAVVMCVADLIAEV